MGGKSESSLKMGSEGAVVWAGTLRVEGGGFCGVRSKVSVLLVVHKVNYLNNLQHTL